DLASGPGAGAAGRTLAGLARARPGVGGVATPRVRGLGSRLAAGSVGGAGSGASRATRPRPSGAGVHTSRGQAKRSGDSRRADGGALDPGADGESSVPR